MYASQITFNSVILNITSIKPIKTQKTIKQIIGKEVSEINVIGLDAQQNEFDVKGIVLGTTTANLDTNRTAVEGLDSATPYDWVDGLHTGTCIMMPGSLNFDDTGEKAHTYYTYGFKLIEQ